LCRHVLIQLTVTIKVYHLLIKTYLIFVRVIKKVGNKKLDERWEILFFIKTEIGIFGMLYITMTTVLKYCPQTQSGSKTDIWYMGRDGQYDSNNPRPTIRPIFQ